MIKSLKFLVLLLPLVAKASDPDACLSNNYPNEFGPQLRADFGGYPESNKLVGVVLTQLFDKNTSQDPKILGARFNYPVDKDSKGNCVVHLGVQSKRLVFSADIPIPAEYTKGDLIPVASFKITYDGKDFADKVGKLSCNFYYLYSKVKQQCDAISETSKNSAESINSKVNTSMEKAPAVTSPVSKTAPSDTDNASKAK